MQTLLHHDVNNSPQKEPEAAELRECCVFTSHRVYHFHRKNDISLSVATEQNKNKTDLTLIYCSFHNGRSLTKTSAKMIQNSSKIVSTVVLTTFFFWKNT